MCCGGSQMPSCIYRTVSSASDPASDSQEEPGCLLQQVTQVLDTSVTTRRSDSNGEIKYFAG